MKILPNRIRNDGKRDLEGRHYTKVSRYTTTAFVRIKLGPQHLRRTVRPHIFFFFFAFPSKIELMPRCSTENHLPGERGMIIRSGLIRNRDGVDFAAFSEHWRRVHGPLALRVEAMRAYRQNHILARLPARQGDRLHRVDGISQLWFDNVESMRVAMELAEQRACIEDIREFLSDVTILI